MNAELLKRLRDAIGTEHVIIDGDLSGWEIDWRKRYHGKALAVVRPSTTEEVACVVKACSAHHTALVPQGGNTGLVGGGVPDNTGSQILLSLTRLNRVRALDKVNLTMTVEAGCVLKTAQEMAANQDLLLPLSLASEGSCTIGGNLATNAGGTQVLRYGNARELCLGLEVVTAHGDIWEGLSGLRKDNTGYALRDLFIGSEGTLGIITAATLKLFPQSIAKMTAMAVCDSLAQCLQLLGLAQARLGPSLTGFEVMGSFARQLVAKHFPQLTQPLPNAAWTALIEQSDNESAQHAHTLFEALLEQALEDGVITNAVVAQNGSQSHTFWHLRESIPLAQAEEGLNIKHDIALPVSCIPAFVQETDAALQLRFPGVRSVNFGHLGDGNLHYNVQAPEGVRADDFLATHETAIHDLVYTAVQAYGGSFSAEHGIGRLKREELTQRKSPITIALMRAIKQAMDPQCLLNPGKLV